MSSFTLAIDTDKASISNPHDVDRLSEKDIEESRRRSVASLLRVVALMLEEGRDVEKIRDHKGGLCGHYTLKQI